MSLGKLIRTFPIPAALAVCALGVSPGQAAAQATVVRVPVDGVIDRGLVPFVRRSLGAAAESDARFAYLDINTPGGRVDAAWEIVDAIQEARLPVYAYVDRALSAGAMIALATEGIYVRPGATIGAATPVTGEGQKASEKMVSAMRSEFRALAEAHELDPRIAEAMVDEEIEIPGLVDAGKLLTLSAEEAVEVGFARAVMPDREALLVELDAGGAYVATMDPNWAELVVRFLTHPMVAPLLLTLGFMGLLFEVKTAGFGVGGAVGLVGLALFFGAHLIVGLAGWEELILIGSGLVLIALEVFVIPGFGIAGALGILGLGAGVVLSMLGRFPSFEDLGQAMAGVLAAMILTGVFAYAFLRHIRWSRRFAGLMLQDSTSRDTGYVSGYARSDLVGKRGRAATALRPTGVGLFGDERLDVVSEGPWVESGSTIEILRSEDYRHVVRKVEDSAGEAADDQATLETGEEP